MKAMNFAQRVIAWQRTHGRHDLPWQNTRDAYAIWVSEIMLQQTQVATVVPYYARFMSRFPTLEALAEAPLDDVLAHWSGLGYYSRARHMHRAAGVIRERFGGRFPQDAEAVAALPGIGRSTAAAIVAFAYGKRRAILDGNVKRVLARHYGLAGYPGDKPVSDALWTIAERELPRSGIERYTQGLMDLGATVCTRARPHCLLCPVRATCRALREGTVESIPAPRPRKALPHKSTVMIVLEHAGSLLLEKRPAPGIWGGLWCFPELGTHEDVGAACALRYGAQVDTLQALPDVEHGFTHFSLTISPRHARAAAVEPRTGEGAFEWFAPDALERAAIPAPVRTILAQVIGARREAAA